MSLEYTIPLRRSTTAVDGSDFRYSRRATDWEANPIRNALAEFSNPVDYETYKLLYFDSKPFLDFDSNFRLDQPLLDYNTNRIKTLQNMNTPNMWSVPNCTIVDPNIIIPLIEDDEDTNNGEIPPSELNAYREIFEGLNERRKAVHDYIPNINQNDWKQLNEDDYLKGKKNNQIYEALLPKIIEVSKYYILATEIEDVGDDTEDFNIWQLGTKYRLDKAIEQIDDYLIAGYANYSNSNIEILRSYIDICMNLAPIDVTSARKQYKTNPIYHYNISNSHSEICNIYHDAHNSLTFNENLSNVNVMDSFFMQEIEADITCSMGTCDSSSFMTSDEIQDFYSNWYQLLSYKYLISSKGEITEIRKDTFHRRASIVASQYIYDRIDSNGRMILFEIYNKLIWREPNFKIKNNNLILYPV